MVQEVALRTPVNALISFHYFRKRDIAEMQTWGMRMIGDCGAFSAVSQGAEIAIDDFLEWAIKWQNNLAWIASLDVIGDSKATFENYKYLRANGVDAVPTIHYGDNPKELDKYADDGIDFCGLGGMVMRKSEVARLMRWTLSVFKYAQDNHPNMRFHGWGITHNTLLMNLPWYSVDSSGFSSSYRFARLSLFDSSLGKNIGIQLDGKEIYKHADLLLREYGCNPDDVAVSNKDTRRQLVRLSIASIQRQEDFLRKRHSVSAPTYGVRDYWTDVSNIHIASGAPQYLKEIGDISISPTQAPLTSNIHAAFGNTDYLAVEPTPHVHVALGPSKAQGTRSVSPFDTLPTIIKKEKNQ